MKKVKFGDITTVKPDGTPVIIVQGCNAQGVMGSGVAKAIREKWPKVYAPYKKLCDDNWQNKTNLMGQVVFVDVEPDIIVANAITQLDFGRDGKQYVSYKAIKDAFDIIAATAYSIHFEYIQTRIQTEVHYPLIGAGLGGGDWSIISNIIDSSFEAYQRTSRTLWINE